jgi:hypothetical protein
MRPLVGLAIGFCFVAGEARSSYAQGAATPADPPPTPHVRSEPKTLPGTRVESFSRIRGIAVDAMDAALPASLVRLRDARMGRVLDTQVTDKAGAFVFFIDPGFYLVELFDKNQQTLAASPLVSTRPGGTSKTSVKLPVNSSLLASLFMVDSQGPGAVTGLSGPVIAKLPTEVLQTIPVIVPLGDPVSER